MPVKSWANDNPVDNTTSAATTRVSFTKFASFFVDADHTMATEAPMRSSLVVRRAGLCLAIAACAWFAASRPHAQTRAIAGYSAPGAQLELDWEKKIQAIPKSDNIKATRWSWPLSRITSSERQHQERPLAAAHAPRLRPRRADQTIRRHLLGAGRTQT